MERNEKRSEFVPKICQSILFSFSRNLSTAVSQMIRQKKVIAWQMTNCTLVMPHFAKADKRKCVKPRFLMAEHKPIQLITSSMLHQFLSTSKAPFDAFEQSVHPFHAKWH